MALNGIKTKLESFFHLEENGTNISTEIRAGLTSFLTISYILVVNPVVMAAASPLLSERDALTGTILSSAASTIFAGVAGKKGGLPFGFAPGVGLSVYLSYGLVASGTLSMRESQTCVFLSGVITLAAAMIGTNSLIARFTPRSVKAGTVVGMGALIALIGMTSVDLVVSNDNTLVALGPMWDRNVLLSLVGLVFIGTLVQKEISGAILIGMTTITAVVWILETSLRPHLANLFSVPGMDTMPWKYFDFDALLNVDRLVAMVPAVLAFHLVAILDISGVVFGLSSLLNTPHENSEACLNTAFIASGIGTIIASCTGSSPIIVTVECTTGVREGGRTGLTAVTIGVLFLLSIFVQPIISKVPHAATAPVLIFIGSMMMSGAKNIDWECATEAISAFLTIMMMPFTYDITNGIVFGLTFSALFYVTTGEMWSDIRSLWKEKIERPVEAQTDGHATESTPLNQDNNLQYVHSLT